MKVHILATLGTVALLAPLTTSAVPTIYSYEGAPYTSFEDGNRTEVSYTAGMRITGSILLDDALPPSFPLQTVNSMIATYTFNDGRVTYAPGANNVARVALGTDAAGEIDTWSITVNNGLVDNTPGFSGLAHTEGLPCGGISSCDFAAFAVLAIGTDSATSFVPGTWTVTAVPEPSQYVLSVIGLVLIGIALRGGKARFATTRK
jgi:hypothetical protein